jgi:putative PIN family toxin of toxin-antitoxin system
MPPLKIVLDTNVYIQSLMRPGSFLDQLIRRAVLTGLVSAYTSPEILLELQHKVEDKFGFTPKESLRLAALCRTMAKVVEPTRRIKIVSRDPDDNKILECALEARVGIIITADRDLLQLKEYEGIKMVHPTMLKYIFPNLT